MFFRRPNEGYGKGKGEEGRCGRLPSIPSLHAAVRSDEGHIRQLQGQVDTFYQLFGPIADWFYN